MTDTIEKPAGTEEAPPVTAEARPNKLGPTAYGNGPVIAAGVLVGGALLLGGWGMAQMIGDHPAKEPAAIAAPSDPGLGEARKNGDGTVTVRLPDEDGNGVPDAFEGKGGNDPGRTGSGTATGRGDEDRPEGSDDGGKTGPGTAAEEKTGVPVSMLVETNRIQNPDLIYAGSALLIPPTG